MGLFDWFTKPGPAQPGAKFQHTDIKTEGAVCNDQTDHPQYRQQFPRRCAGQCVADRQPMTHAGQAMASASFVAGMIDWSRLGPRDEDDQNTADTDRLRAGEAAYREQQRLIAQSLQIEADHNALLLQCSETERAIYQTYLEANALQPGADTLTPMGLARNASGQVVRREGVPVESKRRLR